MSLFLLILTVLLLTLIPLQALVPFLPELARDLWNSDFLLLLSVHGFFYGYCLYQGKIYLHKKSVQAIVLISIPLIITSLLPRPFSLAAAEVLRLLLVIWLFPIFTTLARHYGRSHLSILLVSIATLHATWGVAQFIVQDNLGLYLLGESRLAPDAAGIAKFTAVDASGSVHKIIRAYGPYAHPNIFGGVLAMSLAGFTLSRTYRQKVVSVLLGYILLLAILLTFSRSAWISTALSALVAVTARTKLLTRSSTRKICFLFLITLLLFIPLITNRLTDSQDQGITERQGAVGLWQQIFPKYAVTGVGIGNYEYALERHLHEVHYRYQPWQIEPIHSVPLLVIGEWGLVGTILLLGGGLLVLRFLPQKKWRFLVPLLPLLLFDHYLLTQTAPLVWLVAWWAVLLAKPLPPLATQSNSSVTQTALLPTSVPP